MSTTILPPASAPTCALQRDALLARALDSFTMIALLSDPAFAQAALAARRALQRRAPADVLTMHEIALELRRSGL